MDELQLTDLDGDQVAFGVFPEDHFARRAPDDPERPGYGAVCCVVGSSTYLTLDQVKALRAWTGEVLCQELGR